MLWLDALPANIDRTWKNPNLLRWHGRLWCIDHGSALYFHHSWPAGVGDPARFAGQGFDPSTHVFASVAPVARGLDPELAPVLSEEVLVAACAEVPDSFLDPVPGAQSPDALRTWYVEFLRARLAERSAWLPLAGAA